MSTLGYKHTDEAKAKISAAARRRCENPAEREKMSAAFRGRKHTPETKAKMSATQRGRETPETRAKRSAAQRGKKHSAETKAKMSTARRGELGSNWRGEDVGYVGMHKRADKTLPRACAHADETCKGQLEAAFNHDTPAEFMKLDARHGPYSPRVVDYMRLCHSHHVRYDNRVSWACR